MFQIGDSLRAAREHEGLSLADVEARLHIRSRYLAALEEERFELLPGTVYARAFLRDYAELLGLDSALFLDEYTERLEPPEEPEEARPPMPHPVSRVRLRPRLVLSVVALLVLGGLAAVALLGLTSGPGGHAGSTPPTSLPATPTTTATTATRPRRPPPKRPRHAPAPSFVPVAVRGVGAWDPYGDRHEHDSAAPAATDGNAATFWYTETYRAGMLKPGVGLLLDAGRPVRLRRVVLVTDTPGYVALVQAGAGATGPFHAVSASTTVARTTTFGLRVAAPERYYVVWITKLAALAHVNEVHAFR